MQNTEQAKFEIPQQIIDEFNEIKRKYAYIREIQRHLIVSYLNSCGKGFRAEIKGGSGRKNYTSGGNLKKPYDLSNWKWVKVQRGASIVLVTLNKLDRDPHSGNIHALYDRIGIIYCNCIEEQLRIPSDTGIDLPLDGEKLCKLADILDRTMDGRERD
jgi:hypothetical protein